MKRYILFIILSVIAIAGFPQKADTLTLEICRQLAKENYPLCKQKNLLKEISSLKIQNLNSNWFPQLSFGGQATYQSSVTEIPLIAPGFKPPDISRDQYKTYLDLSQTIWDGGLTNARKNYEERSLESEITSIDVDLEKLNERINLIYFSILLAQQNEIIINNVLDEIKNKLSKVESMIKNEVLLKNNADILKAEILKIHQQLIELSSSKKQALAVLKEFININVSEYTFFVIPEAITGDIMFENNRLENKLFELQKLKLNSQKKLIQVNLMPRIYAFGQGGYGRPGLNMLDNDFNLYYLGGIKVNWNISAFYQYGREKKMVDLQKSIIDIQKENFEKNLKISTRKEEEDIRKLREILKQDYEIIALRENISKTASSQLETGVITSTEYLTEKNAETQARLNLELHKILLVMSQVNYLNSMGKK